MLLCVKNCVYIENPNGSKRHFAFQDEDVFDVGVRAKNKKKNKKNYLTDGLESTKNNIYVTKPSSIYDFDWSMSSLSLDRQPNRVF